MPESKVRLDLNNPVFQETLFRLEKAEQHAMISTLRKVSELTWDQLYRDQGLKWEAIYSRNGPKGELPRDQHIPAAASIINIFFYQQSGAVSVPPVTPLVPAWVRV